MDNKIFLFHLLYMVYGNRNFCKQRLQKPLYDGPQMTGIDFCNRLNADKDKGCADL